MIPRPVILTLILAATAGGGCVTPEEAKAREDAKRIFLDVKFASEPPGAHVRLISHPVGEPKLSDPGTYLGQTPFTTKLEVNQAGELKLPRMPFVNFPWKPQATFVATLPDGRQALQTVQSYALFQAGTKAPETFFFQFAPTNAPAGK